MPKHKRNEMSKGAGKSPSLSKPIYECLAAENIFGTGLGSVWISRKLPNGQLLVAMFLLDVFCLGVKNAMSWRVSRREYKMMLMMNFAESMTPIQACCLKKLVLGAAAYAESLGFSPHEDYAAALTELEGIDARDCEAEYHFGRNGKPFYVRGPNESQAESQRIIGQLQRRCGEDGFDFLTDMGTDEEDEENIATIDDLFEVEQLMSDLERALPFKPRSKKERGSG